MVTNDGHIIIDNDTDTTVIDYYYDPNTNEKSINIIGDASPTIIGNITKLIQEMCNTIADPQQLKTEIETGILRIFQEESQNIEWDHIEAFIDSKEDTTEPFTDIQQEKNRVIVVCDMRRCKTESIKTSVSDSQVTIEGVTTSRDIVKKTVKIPFGTVKPIQQIENNGIITLYIEKDTENGVHALS